MNFAVLLASGKGKRMHNNLPKQFMLVYEKPLLYYSIKQFESNDKIDEIIIVTAKKFFTKIYQIVEQYNFHKVHMLVIGGKTRQESSYHALVALKDYARARDNIIIHDCARPLITQDMINITLMNLQKHPAVSLCHKISNTIASRLYNTIDNYLPRNKLVALETPQAFRFGLILKAHQFAVKNKIMNVSDDSQLIKLIGKKVHLIFSDQPNLKVTYASDLALLPNLLNGGNE